MSVFSRKDEAIEAYKSQIEFLKEMIHRLEQEREAERVEYKRAIDVLLYKEQLPIIGQHAAPVANTMPPLDPKALFAYMEEEVVPEKK